MPINISTQDFYSRFLLKISTQDFTLEDPWLIIPTLFEPCYAGGFSALKNFNLTEQLFHKLFVFTIRPVKKSDELLADTPKILDIHRPYSDLPSSGIQILSYSYPELFAEKIRALGERTRPRD